MSRGLPSKAIIAEDNACSVDHENSSTPYNRKHDHRVGVPFSTEVQGILTDMYQIRMLCAYWTAGKADDRTVFEAYFRKAPFNGTFAVLAGVDEVLRLLNTFGFAQSHISYLREQLPDIAEEFWLWLAKLDTRGITVDAIPDGTVVFPNVPLLIIKGPLGVCQLLETPMLTLLNYATLITTNAARFRLAVGWEKQLLEFGLRRAQGCDGGMSASRYSYLGGFDATSNVRAGYMFDIPVQGTMAHSFVLSFSSLADVASCAVLRTADGSRCINFTHEVQRCREDFFLACEGIHGIDRRLTNEGELAAFTHFAATFPTSFLALIDSYDMLLSGTPNYLVVAIALHRAGYTAIGVRIDSGDLAYLSKSIKAMTKACGEKLNLDFLCGMKVCASNDINECVLHALNKQGHEIDILGIGTNLVTCQAQPALGMVYKLVEIEDRPVMKLTQEMDKATIPSRKSVYRLLNHNDTPVVDLISCEDSKAPKEGERVFCHHLFDELRRCFVVPHKVQKLHLRMWEGGRMTAQWEALRPADYGDYLRACRDRLKRQLLAMRSDHLRDVNPTPYKVSATGELYEYFKRKWQEIAPVPTIR